MQNYSDLFFFFRFGDNHSCVHRFLSHALVYVYCGELEISVPGQVITLQTGEVAFVRKEAYLQLAVCREENKETKFAILQIPESFLREFYFTLEKQEPIFDVPERSLYFVPPRKDLDSLFCSMIPYYGTDVAPGEKILKLKMIEAIYALLGTGQLFYTLLFGFAQGGRTDVFDLLSDTCTMPFHWQKNRKFPPEFPHNLN